MKTDIYEINTSSFQSVEKDFELIVSKMLKNETLKKLLFYQSADCLQKPDLTQLETIGLINRNIRLIPKLDVDPDAMSYIIITLDNFLPNQENPDFRDNIISFDILCHFDTWGLGDYKLRPYKILGELDGMFNNKHLTGIGTLNFISANQLLLSDDLGGFTLMYRAVHGDEDKVQTGGNLIG